MTDPGPTLRWTSEPVATYDVDKERVLGGAPPGALDLTAASGAELPGDWWRVEEADGAVVAYGWLDSTWGGDAEITVAVAAEAQGRGVGGFVVAHLEDEAARRGFNYVYNVVADSHPQRDEVHDWFAVRGYRGSESDAALRKRVVPADAPIVASPPRLAPVPAVDALPPGREESGGYVDVEDHRY